MNSHLNIFKTYTKEHRTYQLENDLTRALAISLQEDSLFFHEFIKEIFQNSEFYNSLFGSLDNEANISINIQAKASQLNEFERIFAISLSETPMGNFWEKKHNRDYDPICDLTIQINDVLLVIEAKRDSIDCTSQVYNQVLNILRTDNEDIQSLEKNEYEENIFPVDLNWKKLMLIAVRVLSFENSFGIPNRFLKDFVSLVKDHNFRWLPESKISSLQNSDKKPILRRVDSAISEYVKQNKKSTKLSYKNRRLGISFSKPWAQELNFEVNDEGNLVVMIYLGNTREQGKFLFKLDPEFNESLRILDEDYQIGKSYHIKFTSFQKSFADLWFTKDELKGNLYTIENFNKYTGRKKRGLQWDEIEKLLNDFLDYDWKEQAKWDDNIINSGKSQFDLTFGYQFSIVIPFKKLHELDTDQENLENLVELIGEINNKFENELIKNS